MNLMTHQDILRELELLPVWKLRFPQEIDTKSIPIESSQNFLKANVANKLETYVEISDALVSAELANEQQTSLSVFRHIASEDGNWLFVMTESEFNSEEEQLLKNIFKALRINAKPYELSDKSLEIINIIQPKLLITMGQVTAQALLRTSKLLEDLRGQVQQFEGIPVFATYGLSDLIGNLFDKEKAWEDLCKAMQYLQETNY